MTANTHLQDNPTFYGGHLTMFRLLWYLTSYPRFMSYELIVQVHKDDQSRIYSLYYMNNDIH